MAKFLIARLSAIGDVAMAIPTIYAIARTNPEHQFTVLTQPFLTTIIVEPPANLEAMAIDIKREERRLPGLLRYATRLRGEGFDGFIDLHDVLRTKVLRTIVGLGKTQVWSIRKPRGLRRRLLAPPPHKDLSPLPSMQELYLETLSRSGLRIPSEGIRPIELQSPRYWSALASYPELTKPEGLLLIGIAPFASTESKTYDLGLMEQVISRLSNSGQCYVFLFGGRGKEADTLGHWASRYARVRSLAGQLELPDELAIMSRLGAMLSMDSANAHLAAMVGTRVISVWCSTHPYAGFMAMGHRAEDCLQDSELDCRPCSIFGKVKRCLHGDMPCRKAVTPEYITERVMVAAQEEMDKKQLQTIK
ncbi:MAG: glycosyltransferase family 9 protein [Porphyromonadaceae bacterium]|nr:glycosyltransferase family 9 protein [Porphyromonadaceae bacterium]